MIISTLPHPELVPWLCAELRNAKLGVHRTNDQIAQSVWRSLCFWAMHDGQPIGFARVITDHATFSFVTDVFVVEAERGKGVGTELMKAVVGHPSVARTISILDTFTAEAFYRKLGWERSRTIMQRNPSAP